MGDSSLKHNLATFKWKSKKENYFLLKHHQQMHCCILLEINNNKKKSNEVKEGGIVGKFTICGFNFHQVLWCLTRMLMVKKEI